LDSKVLKMQKNLLGGLLALFGWVSAGIGTGGTQLFPEFLSNCGYSEHDFTQLVRVLSKELNFFQSKSRQDCFGRRPLHTNSRA